MTRIACPPVPCSAAQCATVFIIPDRAIPSYEFFYCMLNIESTWVLLQGWGKIQTNPLQASLFVCFVSGIYEVDGFDVESLSSYLQLSAVIENQATVCLPGCSFIIPVHVCTVGSESVKKTTPNGK